MSDEDNDGRDGAVVVPEARNERAVVVDRSETVKPSLADTWIYEVRFRARVALAPAGLGSGQYGDPGRFLRAVAGRRAHSAFSAYGRSDDFPLDR